MSRNEPDLKVEGASHTAAILKTSQNMVLETITKSKNRPLCLHTTMMPTTIERLESLPLAPNYCTAIT
jgi:hypothetical protein